MISELSNLVSNIVVLAVAHFQDKLHKQFVSVLFINSKVNFLIGKHFNNLTDLEYNIIIQYLEFYKNNHPIIPIFIDQFNLVFKDKKIDMNDTLAIMELIYGITSLYNIHNQTIGYKKNIDKRVVAIFLKMFLINVLVILCKDLDENKIIDLVHSLFKYLTLDITNVKKSRFCCL